MTRQVTTLARAPAWLALATIVLAVLAGLGPIAAMGLTSGFSAFDSYIFSVIRFTLLQAFLSTLLSIIIAIPVTANCISCLLAAGRPGGCGPT